MKALWALLVAALVVAGTGVGAVAAAGRAEPHFSPLIYPAPVAAAHDGALPTCPNPRGLVPFTSATVRAAAQEAGDFGRATRQAERLASDRSFWSTLREPGPSLSQGERDAAQPASGTTGPGHLIIGYSCGSRLLRDTETVVLVPLQGNGQPQNCAACRAHLYYVDRLGHALLYFLY